MRKLLPVPSSRHVPLELRDGLSPLTEFLDAQFVAWEDETFGLEALKDPARIPYPFLNEAGYMLSAAIRPEDGERVRRVKVSTAAATNKMRGLWRESVQPVVEARSGAAASLISGLGDDDFILVGSADDQQGFWSALGGAEPDVGYGIRLASGASEDANIEPVAGVMLIDCGSGSMGADDVGALVRDLRELIPAYYKAYVGYVSGGTFTTYAGGEVN